MSAASVWSLAVVAVLLCLTALITLRHYSRQSDVFGVPAYELVVDPNEFPAYTSVGKDPVLSKFGVVPMAVEHISLGVSVFTFRGKGDSTGGRARDLSQ